MSDKFRFGELLTSYIDRQATTHGKLARRTQVARKTIFNWANSISLPRENRLTDLVRLGSELRLQRDEMAAWLAAAELPALPDTLERLPDDLLPLVPDGWLESPQAAPFQAPAHTAAFVGRANETQQLVRRLRQPTGTVTVLTGMPGVGKSTLAIQCAYALRDHFPDGVLWAQLDISTPLSVLAGFAEAYGRDVSRLTDLGTRSSAVRSLLATKRALIIYDNVDDEATIRQLPALLPPSTGQCHVILTSRRRDLGAAFGAQPLEMLPFSDARTALDVFAAWLGHERAAAERETLHEIARLLGYLPLALAIAAGRLASDTTWSAADFRDWVAHRRLDAVDDDAASVRLSLEASYAALSAEQQLIFAAAATFGGADFPLDALAHVADLHWIDAQVALRRLHRLSLVERGRKQRYRLHPLVRLFAQSRSAPGAPFVARLIAYYTQRLAGAPDDFAAIAPDAENIGEAIRAAASAGLSRAVIEATVHFYPYLRSRGLYTEAEHLLAAAAEHATTLADAGWQARVACNQGNLAWRQGDSAAAETHLRRALRFGTVGEEPVALIESMNNLANLAARRGDQAEAAGWLMRALETATAADLPKYISELNSNLGFLAARQGRFEQARAHLETALSLARRSDNRRAECGVYVSLGWVTAELDDLAAAAAHFEAGLALAEALNLGERSAECLMNLGVVETRRGDWAAAERYLRQALDQAQSLQLPRRVCHVQCNLGAALGKAGDYPRAAAQFNLALEGAAALNDRFLTADVHYEWGVAAADAGRIDLARQHLSTCASLAERGGFTGLGRKAAAALAQLETISSATSPAASDDDTSSSAAVLT